MSTLDEHIETEEALEESGLSVLDRVKKRRSVGADEEWFEVPSWGGELLMQVQVLDRDDIDKMVSRIRNRRTGKRSEAGIEADLDFLVKACCGVKAIDSETEEEEILTNGINEALAEMLDPHDEDGLPVDVSTSRKLMYYLLKYNGIALAAFGSKVARWMQDTSKPVEDPQ